MTAGFLFGTMTHHGDGPGSGQPLDQPQCELLTVILDRAASSVDRPVHEELTSILADEPRPRDASGEHRLEQPLGGPERWHPDVVAAGRHPAASARGARNCRASRFRSIGLHTDFVCSTPTARLVVICVLCGEALPQRPSCVARSLKSLAMKSYLPGGGAVGVRAGPNSSGR